MTDVERSLFWFVAGAAATAAVAWVAFQVQQEGIAPAVLFPLLVGAALGAALAAIRHFTRRPRRRVTIAAAACWGLLAVVAQDYIGHRDRLRDYDDEMARQHPLAIAALEESSLRPSFAGHLSDTLHSQGIWWGLDAVLTAAAAGLVVGLAARDNAERACTPAASVKAHGGASAPNNPISGE
jgi:hypothetical protein